MAHAPAAAPIIAFQEVAKVYGDTAAVRGLNLTIATGEFYVLIGPSGCGKSTTLHMVNRLSEPSSGRILIDGADASTLNPVGLRREIGFVFQAVGLFPHLTVGENVAIAPRLLGWPPADIVTRVAELLEIVRLPPQAYLHRMPAELSGGQQQRVGLARALAARPRIMLMDEPFAALDPLTRDDLAADYRAIHDRLGLTTVLVTHDMTEAFLLADRITVMHSGEVVQTGSPQELLNAPADDFVRSLIDTPRRRAKRLAELMHVGAGT
ncbi:MAG: ATP-binding cassette domain-containing protein [Alphaproteobacteria bacterium]|nr:ATP-binding cassette domain-containing protein [Alphaproteobacteria bacterium]